MIILNGTIQTKEAKIWGDIRAPSLLAHINRPDHVLLKLGHLTVYSLKKAGLIDPIRDIGSDFETTDLSSLYRIMLLTPANFKLTIHECTDLLVNRSIIEYGTGQVLLRPSTFELFICDHLNTVVFANINIGGKLAFLSPVVHMRKLFEDTRFFPVNLHISL